MGLAVLLWTLGVARGGQGARPTIITGAVLGEGLRPLGGARVRVVGQEGCATATRSNGSFELHCAATGVHVLEASSGALAPSRIEGVELGPDRLAQLTFLLQPATAAVATTANVDGLGAPLPNPVVATWLGRAVSLRALGVMVAAAAFLLGIACLLVVARRLGMERRRLSKPEAAELVLNARNRLAERVRPVVAAGARGVQWFASYGVEEIATAIQARRYGLVAASVFAPASIGVAALGFLLALLVGQPRYLFAFLLLVPAGFLVTPLVMLGQAFRASRSRQGAPPP